MATLLELLESSFNGIDAYVAKNPQAHNYANVEAAKQEMQQELKRLAQYEANVLAKLSPEAVAQASQQHLDYIHRGVDAGFMKVEQARNLKSPPQPTLNLSIKPLTEVSTLNEVIPGVDKALSTRRGTTTIDLSKLGDAEKQAFVEYASHHPQLKPLNITPASTQVVMRNVSVDTIKALPSSMMMDVGGKLSIKKPFIPPIVQITEFNASPVLEGLTQELKAAGAMSPELLDKAQLQAKGVIAQRLADGKTITQTTTELQTLIKEQAELIGHAQNGVLPGITDTATHMAGRLEGSGQTLAQRLAEPTTARRLSLHTELEKLKPTITGFDRKKAAIIQLLEKPIETGTLSPEKMEEVVQHLVKHDAAHLDTMVTHADAATQALQKKATVRKLFESAGGNAAEVPLGMAMDQTEKVQAMIKAGDQEGLAIARAAAGHEQLESVLKSPAKAPVGAPPVPATLTEPPKRKGLSRIFGKETLDEKLFKTGTALEQANAEKAAAEIAFEEHKSAAQKLAQEIQQKRQKIALAQENLEELTKNGAAPELLKTAQIESVEAQKELIAAKQQLNGIAKKAAESKQALNTFSKNAEKAQYAFDVATGKTNLTKVEEFGRETRDRLADKDRALDKHARDLKDSESKLAQAEKKLDAVKTGADSPLTKATSELEAAKIAEQEATQAIERLNLEKAAAAERATTATSSTAERIAATTEVAQKQSAINEALSKQRAAQGQVTKATSAIETAGKPLVAATAAHDAAHHATVNGKYTNSLTSENSIIKEAAREAKKSAAAIDRSMAVAYQGMNGGMVTHTSDQIAAMASRTTGTVAVVTNAAEHSGGIGSKILGGLKMGSNIVAAPFKAGYSYVAKPAFEHAVKPLAVGTFENAGKLAKGTKGMAGNVMLAGVAGVGLLGLAATLSAPKPIAPRITRFDDEPSNPLAFAGGDTSVDLGGVAMPALGQQQGQGNWMSKVPSMEDQLAMNGVNLGPPSR